MVTITVNDDGRIEFRNPTDGSSGTNPNNSGSGAVVVKNALYAKNVVKGWVKGYNQTVIDEAFGLSSVQAGSTANSAIVTWQHSTSHIWDNCYATSAAGTTVATARFLTVGNFSINSCRVYAWQPAGGTVAAPSMADWGIIRMGRNG